MTDYVPLLHGTGYEGAKVRHLLDMRTGIDFSEAYLDPNAGVRVLEQAIGWATRTHPDTPTSMYEYLRTLAPPHPTAARSTTSPATPTPSAGSAKQPPQHGCRN